MNYDLITITLNSQDTLQRTLDSVLAQKYLPAKYIFIDANSEDETLHIINNFKTNSQGIDVIIEQQNGKGISQAWNQALKHTQNEIICLLNSDDWWLPYTMESVLKEFQKDDSLQILSGSILYCKDGNDPKPKLMKPKPTWQMPLRMCFMHPATFVKKDVYNKLGGFNEDYKCSMDYDFMYRALEAKIKTKAINEILTKMQAGGVANSTREIARNETKKIAYSQGQNILPIVSSILRKITNR